MAGVKSEIGEIWVSLYFKGSAAAADTLGGRVPPWGGYDPPGGNFEESKLGSLRVFKAWEN